MKIIIYVVSVLLFIGSNEAFSSAATGKITRVSFASAVASTSRPGSAQLSIQGGFKTPGCNTGYAAVSKDDTHLISLLLMAKAQDKVVTIFLDASAKYFGDRCLVNYIELQ